MEDSATGQELLTNVQAQNALRIAENALAEATACIAALEVQLAAQHQPGEIYTDKGT